MSDLFLLLRLLILLIIANGAPILAKKFLGARFAAPLDGGMRLRDARPLLGRSKTMRGILAALGATALAAPLLGLGPILGLKLATAAMAGDLLSSFLKRRLGLPPHAQALGLDQIPEALLPLLLLRQSLDLSTGDILGLVVAFVGVELMLSRLLFRLHIRERPY